MIIVTGGAGFIGSNLVQGLNQKGMEDIVIVDNLSNASKHLNMNRLQFMDFIDKRDFLERLPQLKGVQAIFHQGACSSTTETDGRYMMENNFEYSKVLLHYALEQEIPFIYASSASVYGDGDKGFKEEREAEYPLNVYAFSKFLFDQYVRRLLPKASSQIAGLRYFNVYGYQEHHKASMASVALHLFKQLQAGESVKLFEGSEGFRRDFIFVEDAVAVNLFLYEQGTRGIYNCGTGEARSFVDIAKALQQFEPSAHIETIPFPPHLEGKYQRFTEANLDNLRAAGYTQAFHSLEEGLAKYFQSLAEHNGFLV